MATARAPISIRPARRSFVQTQVGTTLLVGEFENAGLPGGYIEAFASRTGSVCDGDSGGPAVATDDGVTAVSSDHVLVGCGRPDQAEDACGQHRSSD